ncbi:MAG: TonB-dependent receptor [Candidatus Cloacimonetes bacterium]|nr:TonB-dependent receptor [Candidatus Cloacimonadota bacterium]
MKKIVLFLVVITMLILPLYAQAGKVAGRVTIEGTGEPLANAAVLVVGLEKGTYTQPNGTFSIADVPIGIVEVQFRYMGYGTKSMKIEVKENETSILNVKLSVKSINIEGIKIVSDRAKIETPIAFTDVEKEEITSSLGSRDIPLVLTTTPSVYSTGQGGGAGDARLNIRGFNQRNVAVMINGVPINDMENGWVYWSNWDGLGDATSSIQVQRGLSAVNLAVPSIGGTMNMITDPTKMDKGVFFKQEYGSGGFEKNTMAANSGLVDDKYAFSFNVTRKTGDGVIDATWTDAWSYYLASSYNINDNNRIEFYAAGAPQRHGQNTYMQNMAAYNHDYATDNSGVPTSDLDDYFDDFNESKAGMFYNENWNVVDNSYKGKQSWNGQLHDRYSDTFLNERENYYHKPQINLNWFTKLNEKFDIYSIVYYSGGKGGGSGTFGSMVWDYSGPSRVVNFNSTIAVNDTSSTGSLGILRNSVNNQWTIGAISKAYYQVTDSFKSSFGIDLRTAEIEHYREVRDLLGGDYIRFEGNDFDTTDEDYTKTLGDRIDYNNTNTVDWFGGYLQGEYAVGKSNSYAMFGLSSVKYSFTDHFADNGEGEELFSETEWILGYQGKGGSSYQLTDNLGIFGNAGYVSKCPIFDEVIDDYDGTVAENPENEKFTDFEIGFNFTGLNGLLNVKGDIYYTNWLDQAKTQGISDSLGNEGILFIRGMDSRHAGIELELNSQPISLVRFDLSVSKGDWIYTNDLTATYKNWYEGVEVIDTLECYVKDLKVGDAPQTQLAFATTFFPVSGLSAKASYKYFTDFYASWDPFSRQDPTDTSESWEIPSYGVLDLHFSYKLPTIVNGLEMEAFTHIFNVLDEIYVQDAVDNSAYNAWDKDAYPHTGSAAEVFFGLPRTFNAGVSVKF